MHQIHEKIDLIDLHKDTIDAEVLNSLDVTMENIQFALSTSNPSALHETVVKVPTATWDNISGLYKVKLELQEPVQYLIHHPKNVCNLGLESGQASTSIASMHLGKNLLASQNET